MGANEAVDGRDDELVVLSVKLDRREKALLRADAESKGSVFLSGHTRQVLRDYLAEEFGEKALGGGDG